MRRVGGVVFAVCAVAMGQGQTGVGAKYAARDPHICRTKKAPSSGAPTAEQARQYFTCSAEGEFSHSLYLAENVQVEIGKGRPFNIVQDINTQEIDPSQPVYPIRGSYTQYQCSNVYPKDPWHSIYTAGKNCDIYNVPDAKGLCYKTTFSDWVCKMGSANIQLVKQSVAGPK